MKINPAILERTTPCNQEYRSLEIETPWVKKHKSWNAQLIPKKLQELALAGTYFDSRLLPITE